MPQLVAERLQEHSQREPKFLKASTLAKIDPIPVKNVGLEALKREEARVKVGYNDLGLFTSKSRERNFFLTK